MFKKLTIVIPLLTLLVLGLTACAPFKPVVVPSQFTYTLSPNPIKSERSSYNQVTTLLVLIPEASPGYRSTDMVYTEQPYQLQSYANHTWIAPPSHMLLPLLVQALQGTGHFHAVVGTPFSGIAQYRLNTQLLELRQNFSGAASVEQMAVAVQLTDNRTQKVIASQVFKVQVAAGNNPQSGVVAANRATQEILQKIARFVVANS